MWVGKLGGAQAKLNKFALKRGRLKSMVKIWEDLQTILGKKQDMHPSVHCSTVYDSQDMEATQMIINRGMNKDVVHISNGILLDHKKERN